MQVLLQHRQIENVTSKMCVKTAINARLKINRTINAMKEISRFDSSTKIAQIVRL